MISQILDRKKNLVQSPLFRKLRGYAFDPSLSLKPDTSEISVITYKVPWEKLEIGPSGEYLEVIDRDPTLDCYYEPVNLDDQHILACDGLDPSEANPQFHQQMVYAVAMTTIRNFEKALGRKILWSSRIENKEVTGSYESYVKALRLYPHGLREANAYYSPLKKAVLFGYFSAMPANDALQMPYSLVFTCLSHDIIAHEITHAILDGMHRSYNDPSNPDVLAFHEAFSDIVALFQHFSFPEVLRHQISRTRGDLGTQNLLGELAQQFGTAIGSYGSLRDALGGINDDTGKWEPKVPKLDDYRTIMEPHERGSLLVSAVFEAFITIYKNRTSDLVRIASNGSGILPHGELHPDLTNRLAEEAARAARHVLTMCIRALDYCPPIDITFGDFLRALITADIEVLADDNRSYRLAFIDAFRRRGIYPSGIKTLNVQSLQWPLIDLSFIERKTVAKPLNLAVGGPLGNDDTKQLLDILGTFLRDYANEIRYISNRKHIWEMTRNFIRGGAVGKRKVQGLHQRLKLKFSNSNDFARITGLAFILDFENLGIGRSSRYDGPSFQIQNLRLVNRVGPEGAQVNQVVFSLVQKAFVKVVDGSFSPASAKDGNAFEFKGGCTIIFDLDTLSLKYAISKPIVSVETLGGQERITLNDTRLKAQYQFFNGSDDGEGEAPEKQFNNRNANIAEPFAFLHQH